MKTLRTALLVVATLQLVACETLEVTSKDGTTTKSSKLDPNAVVLIGKGLDVASVAVRPKADGKTVVKVEK